MPDKDLTLRDVQVLKQLALSGALEDSIDITSKGIADLLDITQQTASLRILNLLENGYISRRMRSRKQGVRITSKGTDILRKEYSEYMRIFDFPKQLVIEGIISSGLGEGRYYMSQSDYKKQFKEKLWFEPFEGTLNISLTDQEATKLRILKDSEGIPIEGFRKGGRTFGDSKCFFATVSGLECAVIMPVRTHYYDTMEVICRENMRAKLRLKDGDKVELYISV